MNRLRIQGAITTIFLAASFVVAIPAAAQMPVSASQPVPRSLRPGETLDEVFHIEVHNNTAEAETLTSVTLTNSSSGSGTQAQLDGEWTALSLILRDSAAPETVVATATFSVGTAVLSGFMAPVAAGDSLILSVQGGTPLVSRDSDILDLMVAGPADLGFTRPVPLAAAWPLAPGGYFIIDGMVADQISLEPRGPANFPVGSTHNVALEIVIPANGYEADELSRVNLINLGTAQPNSDITLMEAWADDGDSLLDPGTDSPLGEFLFTGDRWELTGLAAAVPLSGLRLFVTVDVAELAGEGRSIRLSLPALPDVAIGMASDNDGPIDREIANPFELSISNVDRVTFAAVTVAPGVARAGDNDYLLLHLTAINSHAVPKRITGLTFANATIGIGTQAELDGEIEQLILRHDENGNGVLDVGSDPVLGTAVFFAGAASMSGFSWELPAGGSGQLFLTGNLSLTEAADGDLLGATLAQSLDIEFDEPTAVAASWPVDSGARWAVDGMLARQITNFGGPVATLSGGDGPVVGLDLIVPANGYASDELNAIRVLNLGTATGADLAEVRLWRDDGDGLFEGSGEDIDLGPMVWLGGSWESPFLVESLTGSGARFFVSLMVASTPTDSATVRLAVPVGGFVTASENDGPIDQAIENPSSLLLSLAPLLSTITVDPPVSTMGAMVTVRMEVENASAEPIDAIAPTSLTEVGSGDLTWLSGPQPPSFSLAPGASDAFIWTYTSAQVGEIRLSGYAEGTSSGLPRRSTESASNTHRVLLQADQLGLFATGTLPPSVNRGETALVALNLTFTNGGGPEASDVLVRGLRIFLEDESGAPIVPAQLLSRLVVNEGSNVYLVKTALETSGSEVDLRLALPVRVTSLEPVTVSVSLDVSSTTIEPNFRAVIPDGGAFAAEDAVSGAPVVIDLQAGSYPISSGLARLRAAATELRVEAVPGAERRTEPGWDDVPFLSLNLENVGIDLLTSDVHLVSLVVAVTDTNDVLLPDPTAHLQRISLRSGSQNFTGMVLSPGDSSRVGLNLSPILSLPVNTPRELRIAADIADSADVGAFRLRLEDPVDFRARDANTGEPVSVNYVSAPIVGRTVFVESPAETLLAGGTSALPPAVTTGTTGLTAMRLSLRHPGVPGTARIRCDRLTVEVRDQVGAPVVPATTLDRLRVVRGAIEIGTNPDPPATGSSVPLSMSAILLEPGETAELELLIDLQATAPTSHLELWIQGASIEVFDATSGLVVDVQPMPGQELPLTSGLTQLRPPPRELRVSLESQLPRVLAAGANQVAAGRIELVNTAAQGSGPITVDHLTLRGGDRELNPVPVGVAVTRIYAYLDEALWAESGALAVDQAEAELIAPTPLFLDPGTPRELELHLLLREDPATQTFRLAVSDSGVGVVQPASALLAVVVEPTPGTSFPLWTAAGSFSASTLEESYSNFPNPFAAGRQATSFVYYLPAAGRVTLKIWSPRGEHVLTLIDDVPRSPGLHQSDRWDGRNGRGDLVISDVFLAELLVDYESGGSSRLLRKVAVVR